MMTYAPRNFCNSHIPKCQSFWGNKKGHNFKDIKIDRKRKEIKMKKEVVAKRNESGKMEYLGEGLEIQKEVEEYVKQWKERE